MVTAARFLFLPDAWPAIYALTAVKEDYACRLKSGVDGGKIVLAWHAAPFLEINNSVARHVSRFGQHGLIHID